MLIFVRTVLTYRQVLHPAQELVLQPTRGVQPQGLFASHTTPLLCNHSPLSKVVFIIQLQTLPQHRTTEPQTSLQLGTDTVRENLSLLAGIVDATAVLAAGHVEDVTVAGEEVVLGIAVATVTGAHRGLTHLKPNPSSGDVEGRTIVLGDIFEVVRRHQVGDHGQLSLNNSCSELSLLNLK